MVEISSIEEHKSIVFIFVKVPPLLFFSVILIVVTIAWYYVWPAYSAAHLHPRSFSFLWLDQCHFCCPTRHRGQLGLLSVLLDFPGIHKEQQGAPAQDTRRNMVEQTKQMITAVVSLETNQCITSDFCDNLFLILYFKESTVLFVQPKMPCGLPDRTLSGMSQFEAWGPWTSCCICWFGSENMLSHLSKL